MTDELKDAQSSVNDELLAKSLNDNPRAFPYNLKSKSHVHSGVGMSLQEYAAIHLKVPDSGNSEIDAMIRKSLRNDFAKVAMSINIGAGEDGYTYIESAEDAYNYADFMLKDMGK